MHDMPSEPHELWAEIETEYAAAEAGESSPEWLAAWHNGTEQARRRTPELRVDIAYGKRRGEKFDLYLPNLRPRKQPFALFVHGGAWRRSLRADSGFAAPAMHRLGLALAVAGFDGLPDVGIPGQAEQVRRAWAHLLQHAERLGLDPQRGHLIGHSSGALLAALAAFDPDTALPASLTVLSGVYDIAAATRPPEAGPLSLDAALAARLSPVHRIPRGGPPVLVAWGDADPPNVRVQSMGFMRACRARGLAVKGGELPGRGHIETSFALTRPDSAVLELLRERR